ncbi:MAG: penicillin-binding protein 2 [Deltaproteobacteria bacterium]|nr:MAG: penicillin-binding protein 2 [Deltaproteobacteria bacterium]TNF31734.1 MAG: penicillin-binding protein 2 [Deltaproteobacteria bacterium]
MFGEDDIVRSHKGRLDLIGNIVVLFFLVIFARLWYLQIYSGKELYRYSIENTLRKETVNAPRGMIFSRNNQLLIHNIPRFDAVIIPQYLKNKKESIKKLGMILKMTPDEINKILIKNRGQARYRPVVIKKNISRKEVAIIETENFKMPGVMVQTFISREYSDKEIGGHLLGYISEISQAQLPKYRKRDKFNYKLGDFIGQAGLEEQMDLQLRGEDGFEFVRVDARGRVRKNIKGEDLFSEVRNMKATPGNNLRLTVDRDLQIAAYESLEGKVGSAVAVDVNSGEILAMVSRPSFDPTQFSRGLTSEYWKSLIDNENNPLRDRTIQEHYSPGSTFKTITAIAALEEGIVKKDQVIQCGPTFKLGRRRYHDWKKDGHGPTDVYKSLKRSVDVYFYKIATQLDIDVLADYARKFGLGTKTGISLPRETSGLIPDREWKKKRFGEEWQLGETLSCSIGQSYILTTPLQLAMAYAAIANGGTLYHPYLIKEIFKNDGEVIEKFSPKEVSKLNISKDTLEAIKKGLYQVVNEQKGTAWWYRGVGIRMAGKTGTSQVKSMTSKELFSKCEEMPYRDRHHGIFVGYAPAYDPKIAVAVVVEHGCHGSSAAAPVVRDVITKYMKKYYPQKYALYAEEDKKKMKQFWLDEKARKEKLKKESEEKEEVAAESTEEDT